MNNYRIKRISSSIKKELSCILRDLNSFEIQRNLLSIVKVSVSQDLSVCKVYISILKSKVRSYDVFASIQSSSKFIRKELAKRLQLKRTPEIKFYKTDSIEYAIKLKKVLEDLS
ncbi:MAG: 30S ribosome-binding factor RbfA [Oscillospiraceae bacterium]|nr:30S ribosome-binding factor RbfA [Oscillospiraceae bacterium]